MDPGYTGRTPSPSFAHLTFATILHLCPVHRGRSQGLARFKIIFKIKQQTLVSHGSGVWEVQDPDTPRFDEVTQL